MQIEDSRKALVEAKKTKNYTNASQKEIEKEIDALKAEKTKLGLEKMQLSKQIEKLERDNVEIRSFYENKGDINYY